MNLISFSYLYLIVFITIVLVMGFTNYAYKNYFIQEIENLNNPEIPELDLKDSIKLTQQYFLSSQFHGDHAKEKMKPVIYYILRRTQISIETYEIARGLTIELTQKKGGKIGVYVSCINHWENIINYLCQIYILHKDLTDKPYYTEGENTSLERLTSCYNSIKHVNPQNIPKGKLQLSHLTNSGIEVNKHKITYVEIKDLIHEVYSLSKKIASQKTA